jgi:GNAT superfamily N-acetyltransferase
VAELIVRAAAASELAAAADCYEWLFEPPGVHPPRWDRSTAIERLREVGTSDRSAVLVALAEDQVVGICVAYLDILSVRYGQRCWIEDLAVHPDWRSRQVGARLMDAAAQWATGRGATHVELDSGDGRTRAHRFYESRKPSWTARSFGWELS